MIISSPSHVVKWLACALPSFPSRIPSRDRASRHSRVLEGRERSTPCRGWTTKGGQQKQKVSSSCLKCRVNDSFRCIYPHTKLDGGAYVYIYNCLHHRQLPRILSYALYLHSPISCSSNAFSPSLSLAAALSLLFPSLSHVHPALRGGSHSALSELRREKEGRACIIAQSLAPLEWSAHSRGTANLPEPSHSLCPDPEPRPLTFTMVL